MAPPHLRFRPWRVAHWVRMWHLRRSLYQIPVDIHHPVYYEYLAEKLSKRRGIPMVATVWDMIHERFADTLPNARRIIRKKTAAIEAADAILCISESTRADLLELHPGVEGRVVVTPLGSELDVERIDESLVTPPPPYFLFVGERTVYKGFETALQALSRVMQPFPEARLCVVGPAFTPEEKRRVERLNVRDRVDYWGVVSDSQLCSLYRASVALVYPSRYEGFGLPVLEAMRCRTAVIACRSSSIPEIAGDAALLFAPGRVSELADMMQELLTNTTLRDSLIEAGNARCRMFSWEKTASATVEVYRSLLRT